MNEETRNKVVEFALLAALVGLQVLAYDQRAQITVRAWAMRWRQRWRDARDAYHTGDRLAEWFVRDQAAAVVADAERITQEAQ